MPTSSTSNLYLKEFSACVSECVHDVSARRPDPTMGRPGRIAWHARSPLPVSVRSSLGANISGCATTPTRASGASPLRRRSNKIFRRLWRETLPRLGLPAYCFHDFRRTAYHDLIGRWDLDLSEAMALIGHKSMSSAKRYNIISPERMLHGIMKKVDRQRRVRELEAKPARAARAAGPARPRGMSQTRGQNPHNSIRLVE